MCSLWLQGQAELAVFTVQTPLLYLATGVFDFVFQAQSPSCFQSRVALGRTLQASLLSYFLLTSASGPLIYLKSALT